MLALARLGFLLTSNLQDLTSAFGGNLNSIAATTNSAYTGCTQESGFSSTADGNNHLPAWAYDASGNTTSDGVVTSYVWKAESELKSAAGVTYTYDGDGRRVAKVGSKLYWYGSGDDILAETDACGNTTAEYIFFGGKRIAMIPWSGASCSSTVAGNPSYYVEDLLGTSRVLTTNTGVVCYDADFYPFGGERSYTNTCPQNYKFEGKERDTETGNDDFGARYYSNRFGRWLSADWSSVPVPVPYANLSNPQTLNLYAMVSDDPESFADLDGHLEGPKSNGPQSSGCNNDQQNCNTQQTQPPPAQPPAQENESVFVFKVEAGGEIGAEAKLGPVTASLGASAGVEVDPTKPSAEASIKVNADIKAGQAQIGGEGKLSVATLDKDGLHAELKPSATLGLGGEKKTFGTGAKNDTSEGFIVSGTVKAGVAKVEVGVNLTALKNKVVQGIVAARQFFSLDFRGPVPQYVPPSPQIR